MSKISRWMLVCLLVVGGLTLMMPQEASARCTAVCDRVPHPTNPWCRQCVEIGEPVGANCINVGACFCRYEDVCVGLTSTTASPLDGVFTEEPAATAADAAAPAEEPTKESEESVQRSE